LGHYWKLDPLPFALPYIKRVGLIDRASLQRMAPQFMHKIEKAGLSPTV
jgi:hypothetical protein